VIDLAKRRLSQLCELLAESPNTSLSDNLRAFRFLVLVHASVQSWGYVARPLRSLHLAFPQTGIWIVSVTITACSVLALTRYSRWAPVIALPALFARLCWSGLWTPNHTYLAFFCVTLTAVLDPEREDEGVLLQQSLRWMTFVVFFYTGLQKLLHGYWFRGEFLAWMVSHGTDTWRSTFGWLLSAEELARMKTLGQTMRPDTGPYRIESVPFVLLSNFTWIAEMVLPVLLLLRRTRVASTIFAIAFVAMIQLAPRESMFFLGFTNLLLLFLPGNWNLRLAPVIAFCYIYLIAALIFPEQLGNFAIKASGRI